jgi:DNA-binding transcriptional ArsR family regulator
MPLAAHCQPIQIGPMTTNAQLAAVAACAGDPARASMLMTLVDGRAFTAGELSAVAGVTAQTASGHLSRLVDTGLVKVARQGRHRYYRLASPLVGQMLEGILVVAGADATSLRFGPNNAAMRFARSCYDHLAGRLGVAIAQSLVDQGYVSLSDEGGEVTAAGRAFFARRRILDAGAGRRGRAFCRPCLDWSERRYHIAGVVGASLLGACLQHGWLTRSAASRTLNVTTAGRKGLRDVLGVDVARLDETGR